MVTSKLNKVKDKFTRKKKKDKTNLEDSKSQRFSSNGSLLSQNGLKPALAIEAEAHKTVGGEQQQQQPHQLQHICCEGKLQQQQQQQQLQQQEQQPAIFSISTSAGDFQSASLDLKDAHILYSADKGKFYIF